MENKPEASKELTLNQLIINFIKFLRFLFSKWIFICAFGILGSIAGILYGWLQAPNYEATLTFSTQNNDASSGVGISGIAEQFGFNFGGVSGVFSGDNIISFIQSRKLVILTLLTAVDYKGKKKSLLDVYLDVNNFSKAFKGNNSLENLTFPLGKDQHTFSRLQDSVLLVITDGLLKSSLKVSRPDKDVEIYSIDCISNNEFFSAEFTKQLITQVSTFYKETKTRQSKETVDVIQQRADSIKKAFYNAIEGRAYLSDANINSAFQLPQVGVEQKQTDITILGTGYGEILKNLEIAKFNLLNETPYIQIIDEPIEPLNIVKLGKLKGGILGGLLFGFLAVLLLTAQKLIRDFKKHEQIVA